jgi:phospho-N-acetylmuramoyl-pentapeptide-transferase
MNGTQIIILLLSGFLSFGIAFLLGKWLIPALQRLHFGQTIREEGPAWHQSKQGTPTMGGILFITATMVVSLLMAVCSDFIFDQPVYRAGITPIIRFLMTLFLALGCGAIGFLDDYIKVVKKRNLGLTALQKLLAQITVALIYAIVMYYGGASAVYVPFLDWIDFSTWYIPFTVFVIVAMSNAANLTDGVDGLCGSVSFTATLPLIVLGGSSLASASAAGINIISVSFAGALVAFLMFNLHPAKVFMGDTGSLFIGGTLTGLAFALGHPFLLLPIGIVFIAENLSVILQVVYFKATKGKRLFKMSPLHHHFEMCGWSENKIVAVFSAVTLIGSAIGLVLLFV